MLFDKPPTVEFVVQTTRNTRTGEESRKCYIDYAGNNEIQSSQDGALEVRKYSSKSSSRRTSKHLSASYASSSNNELQVVTSSRRRSRSRGRVHGTGCAAEASLMRAHSCHGSATYTTPEVSQYHVEVRSSKSRPVVRSISRDGRSRRSTHEIDIDHVTVYQLDERRQRSPSRSRKSKSSKSKRSSKSKSRRKHRSRSRSSSRTRTSTMAIIPVPVEYPVIQYAEPTTVTYPMITYHPAEPDVRIAYAEPPAYSYVHETAASIYHAQPPAIVHDTPPALVSTTGPGQEYYTPGVPKARYFISATSSNHEPVSPIIVNSRPQSPPLPGGARRSRLSMHGAVMSEAELHPRPRPRPHSISGSEYAASLSHTHSQRRRSPSRSRLHADDHERRYNFSGSTEGHAFATSANYHHHHHHHNRPSANSSSTSLSSAEAPDRHSRKSVYIGTEHLRREGAGHHGVRVRYGGEKEHVVGLGFGYTRPGHTSNTSIPAGSLPPDHHIYGGGRISSSGSEKEKRDKEGLRNKLKIAAPVMVGGAMGIAGLAKKKKDKKKEKKSKSGSSSSSSTSSSSSSTSSTSSSD